MRIRTAALTLVCTLMSIRMHRVNRNVSESLIFEQRELLEYGVFIFDVCFFMQLDRSSHFWVIYQIPVALFDGTYLKFE